MDSESSCQLADNLDVGRALSLEQGTKTDLERLSLEATPAAVSLHLSNSHFPRELKKKPKWSRGSSVWTLSAERDGKLVQASSTGYSDRETPEVRFAASDTCTPFAFSKTSPPFGSSETSPPRIPKRNRIAQESRGNRIIQLERLDAEYLAMVEQADALDAEQRLVDDIGAEDVGRDRERALGLHENEKGELEILDFPCGAPNVGTCLWRASSGERFEDGV
ncbi:hypothetical protein C8J56DRAFT_1051551 [Mycena floridula]|nr:hypothetical protein C8J56DRAFT_1051551 [Mycena floridula]